ncbi:MAG: hypothetical protein LUO88_03190 [Methanoregulaceae archaeon]|nr:hypothetical protein [Methanoregulaceae archaeon]
MTGAIIKNHVTPLSTDIIYGRGAGRGKNPLLSGIRIGFPVLISMKEKILKFGYFGSLKKTWPL